MIVSRYIDKPGYFRDKKVRNTFKHFQDRRFPFVCHTEFSSVSLPELFSSIKLPERQSYGLSYKKKYITGTFHNGGRET